MQDLLFYSGGELSHYLVERERAVKKEIENFERDYLLNASEGDLIKYLSDKYFLDPPTLCEDDICVHDQSEADIDVSRDPDRIIFNRSRPVYVKEVSITIAIPFDGDGELFNYRPSTFSLNPPRAEINGQEVHLIYQKAEHDAEKLKEIYTRDVGNIKQHLSWIKRDVENFNKSLEELIRGIIKQRKEKLLKDLGLVGKLGIPIRRRNDIPKTYSVPEIRRKPKIERPKITEKPFQPEPALDIKEYDHVLSIIQNMVLVMERSPRAFANMKEEDLRQHFLVQLNGQYEGQATAETFNYEGKTDILIRIEGKNVFIAECKFWRGEKELLKTIDQLLGYTSWRDTKTAILLFNRGKNFSAILEKIPSILKSHACYKRELEMEEETSFRYTFHQPDDPNRELFLSVMAFNVPNINCNKKSI
jgi:hypothetical protein